MKNLRSVLLLCAVISVFILSSFSLTGCGVKKENTEGVKTGAKSGAPSDLQPAEGEAPAAAPSSEPITEERVLYGFETDIQGWEVPEWAKDKADYVASDVSLSREVASQGTSSMKTTTNFPGDIWAAGLVEIQQYLDLSQYRVISADAYIPADAPLGLKAKLILVVGNNWKFVEMNQSAPLIPGGWVTITANIEPGSYDWKRVIPNEEFAEDVRKIAVRVESNRKPKYSGPIFIDNVRVGR